jgi:hypothetical protein
LISRETFSKVRLLLTGLNSFFVDIFGSIVSNSWIVTLKGAGSGGIEELAAFYGRPSNPGRRANRQVPERFLFC